jgi:hypothetical protein
VDEISSRVPARSGALFVVALGGVALGIPQFALLRSVDGGRRWTRVSLPAGHLRLT